MTYTRQVVREVLRFRPPAPMVPQITQAPFPLSEDYVAPKGSLIMPSLIAACQQVGGLREACCTWLCEKQSSCCTCHVEE